LPQPPQYVAGIGISLTHTPQFPYKKVFVSLQRSRPFLVTFSGEAEKVTARRAGALQRGEAKLRRNSKPGSLRRRSPVRPK
jgi:hypothetical protein